MHYLWVLSISIILFTGCKTREYSLPKLENHIPDNSSYTYNFTDQNFTGLPTIQSFIEDDFLISLLNEAFAENPDWKIALTRLELAYAEAGYRISYSRPFGEIGLEFIEGEQKNRITNFQKEKIPNWKVNGLLSWELDLLGKWKHIEESNKYEILSANQEMQASKISLIHEIAQAWFEIRYLQEDLLILQKSLDNHSIYCELYVERQKVGLEENATIIKQFAEKNQVLLEKNQRLRKLDLTKLRLKRLLGSPLGEISSEITLLSEQKIPTLPKVIPSWVLRNRPDLQAAESRLVSHFHLEKSAVLNLYPSFGLNLSGTGMSNSISKPFKLWSAQLGPLLKIPFLSPTRRQKIEIERVHLKIIESEWKAMITKGVEEIEAAFVSFKLVKDELKLSEEITQQSKRILQTTRKKLTQGIVSQIQLLEDERRFLNSGRMTLLTRLEFFKAAIGLSKCLGLSTE